MRFAVIWFSAAALMAACGGAQDDSTLVAGASRVGDGVRSDAGTREQAQANDATFLANEYQSFDLGGAVRSVRYGFGNSWVVRDMSGRQYCGNSTFGSDPAFLIVKRCELLASSSPAAAPSPGGWNYLADEGGWFRLNGTQTVRYGAGGVWVQANVSDSGQCTNAFFGTDPVPNVFKRCEVLGAAAAPVSGNWTYLAGEGGSFDVAGTKTVRYGSGGAWVQASVSNRGLCTNGFFGTDPAPNVVKQCELSSDGAASPAPAPAPTPAPPPASPPPAGARSQAAIMVSGHSLTSHGIFANMEAVAGSLGTTMLWNEQNIPGSPMRARTRGGWLDDPSFGGYRQGTNRNGSNMDLVAEFLNPRTIGGARYDTLVVTERHDIVNTLMWEDTVRYTRHFHDRLVAGNGAANTLLYHAWLTVANKSDPMPWVRYERTAARAWQCTAARVSLSLAAQGRGDRVGYLPAGLALADLVERALQGGVAGVSGGSTFDVVNRLIYDDVHLTPLGEYYMALVSYASIYRRSPVGAWVPGGVTAQQASALQNVAWESVSAYFNGASVPSMDQCQAAMRDQICSAYGNYANNPGVTPGCVAQFTEASQRNPFRYDAGSDGGYWFPAPR
jgi:hypothetical protein